MPESVEAVWGGVIGMWHAITAAGLLYGWSLHPDAAYTSVATAMHGGHASLDESMFWFRRFVCLEVVWGAPRNSAQFCAQFSDAFYRAICGEPEGEPPGREELRREHTHA